MAFDDMFKHFKSDAHTILGDVAFFRKFGTRFYSNGQDVTHCWLAEQENRAFRLLHLWSKGPSEDD